MKDPTQKMRFTDGELALMKGVFAGNDELLYIVRKAMLQFELTEQERNALDTVLNEQTKALIYKIFLPNIDPDAPLFQMADLILGLGAEVKEIDADGAWPFMLAKGIEQDYIAQQLKALTGSKEKPAIVLAELANIKAAKTQREQVYANVLARNYLLSYIDSNIQQIKFLAGQREETVEQTKARLARDSAK